MSKFRRFGLVISAGVLFSISLTVLVLAQPANAPLLPKPTPTTKALAQESAVRIHKISGIVVDANGPVAGATVQVHLAEKQTTTAADGSVYVA